MPMNKPQREAAKAILTKVDTHKPRNRVLADVFQELPPREDLPDYYDVIKKPMALDAVKSRARNGRYASFDAFLLDLAQIFHNAKTYNKPKSIIHNDATALEELLDAEVRELHARGVTALERLPTITDEPEPEPEASADEDENMEDAGSSDGEEAARTPAAKRQRLAGREEQSDQPDTPGEDGRASPSASKRRGRPPKVETPDEGRMKNVLKAVRKVQRGDQTLYEPFEKLPDAKEYPDYYEKVKNPMSLALVKKNIKRKVYTEAGMDHFVRDLKTIFTNAMFYNEDDSSIYEDAAYFLKQLDDIVRLEVAKPDGDFANLDTTEKYSALPGAVVKLARKGVTEILLRGESYKVGDWVYLENPNDPPNPIIAQIFRTWQNSDGEYWVNVCWYYRPHQTVHRADKLWIPREVVKTGQYRDHAAQEMTGHCYVMYVTKYVRGRPKEWTGSEEDLFVCENRYNEEMKTYNKIKAWKSCVPEQSREQSSNYDMYVYPEIRTPRKQLSPLLYLMPEDKSLWVNPPLPGPDETPFKAPEPRDRGATNAPPKEGNIIVTSVPSEQALAEINGDNKPERHAATTQYRQVAPAGSVPATPGTPYGQQQHAGAFATPRQVGGRPAHVLQDANVHRPSPTLDAAHLPAGTYQPVAPRQAPGPTTPGQQAFAQQQQQHHQLPQQAVGARPGPSTLPRARASGTPLGAVQQQQQQQQHVVPHNVNKLNSLGSQVNPTCFLFLGSLALAQPVRGAVARDHGILPPADAAADVEGAKKKAAAGEVLWFSVPPVDAVAPEQRGRVESHSARYLAWKVAAVKDRDTEMAA